MRRIFEVVRGAHWIGAGVLMAFIAVAGCDDSKDVQSQTGAVTFWQDVAPIYNDKCVKCHQQGGIGPFRLDNFTDAKFYALPALAQVSAGTMPPYFERHDGTCGQFHDEETLTAEETSKIVAWASGAKKEGTPITLSIATQPRLADAVAVSTPPFSPVAQGGELAQFDEYRCFPLDAPTATPAFVTGYEVDPGEPSIIHHVIAFIVDPDKKVDGIRTNADIMAALDAESPDRLGWPCFGAAGDNVDVSAVPVTWAPGQGVVSYPDGMGVPLRPTDKLVVQIHYNLSDPASAGKTDTTQIHLRLRPQVERQLAFLLPDPFLDSLNNPQPDSLPPGQVSTRYTWNKTGKQIGLAGVPSVDLVAVMPHMHGRGTHQMVRAGAPGDMACLSQLDNWNFHWQKFYSYKTFPQLTPATDIEVSCDYNTSADTSPVLPGWGTKNEMCLPILMVALPAQPPG
jgi:hypothetical protein